MVSIKAATIAVLIGMLAAASAAYATSALAGGSARHVTLKAWDSVTIGKTGIRCNVRSNGIDCAARGGVIAAPPGTLMTVTDTNRVEVWRREKNARVTVVFSRKF